MGKPPVTMDSLKKEIDAVEGKVAVRSPLYNKIVGFVHRNKFPLKPGQTSITAVLAGCAHSTAGCVKTLTEEALTEEIKEWIKDKTSWDGFGNTEIYQRVQNYLGKISGEAGRGENDTQNFMGKIIRKIGCTIPYPLFDFSKDDYIAMMKNHAKPFPPGKMPVLVPDANGNLPPPKTGYLPPAFIKDSAYVTLSAKLRGVYKPKAKTGGIYEEAAAKGIKTPEEWIYRNTPYVLVHSLEFVSSFVEQVRTDLADAFGEPNPRGLIPKAFGGNTTLRGRFNYLRKTEPMFAGCTTEQVADFYNYDYPYKPVQFSGPPKDWVSLAEAYLEMHYPDKNRPVQNLFGEENKKNGTANLFLQASIQERCSIEEFMNKRHYIYRPQHAPGIKRLSKIHIDISGKELGGNL